MSRYTMVHQVLARAAVGRGANTDLFGEQSLEIEQQAVFVPLGEVMQADAQCRQQRAVARDLARLGSREQPDSRELAPVRSQAGRTRDPGDGLQVAQPARAFLEVRLEVVIGFRVASMASLLLLQLGKIEGMQVEVLMHAVAQFLEQLLVAAQQARVKEVGLYSDVG